MRDHIIREIKRVAKKNGGQPPGVHLFQRETEIAEHVWRGKFWARWTDALAEAGFAPNSFQQKMDSNLLLRKVAEASRHYGRLPTTAEMMLYRQIDPDFPTPKTVGLHYPKSELQEALRSWVARHSDYTDLLTILPQQPAVLAGC